MRLMLPLKQAKALPPQGEDCVVVAMTETMAAAHRVQANQDGDPSGRWEVWVPCPACDGPQVIGGVVRCEICGDGSGWVPHQIPCGYHGCVAAREGLAPHVITIAKVVQADKVIWDRRIDYTPIWEAGGNDMWHIFEDQAWWLPDDPSWIGLVDDGQPRGTHEP